MKQALIFSLICVPVFAVETPKKDEPIPIYGAPPKIGYTDSSGEFKLNDGVKCESAILGLWEIVKNQARGIEQLKAALNEKKVPEVSKKKK